MKRPPLYARHAIALACLQLIATTAFAQTALLPEIEVVAKTPLPGANQSIDEIPSAVQTIGAKKIATQYATNLGELLNNNLSGVHVNDIQNNPFQMDVNYRGFTASPLLGTPQGLSVYVDGVRMNQPFGDVVSWDLMPKSAIKDIALMPGSNPLFGLNTLGGAISVQTKDGFSNPGTSIEVSGGSFGRRNATFETGGHNDRGLHWFLTTNSFAERGWRDASPSNVQQLFGKVGFVDAKTDISLSLAGASNRMNGNGMQEFRLLDKDWSSVYTKPDETKNNAIFANLVGKREIADGVELSGNAYYRRINTRTYNGDINDESIGNPDIYDNNVYTPFPSAVCLAEAGTGPSGGQAAGEPAEVCTGVINRTVTKQDNYGLSGQLTFENALFGRKNKFTAGAGYDGSSSKFYQSSQWGYINSNRSIIGVANADGLPAIADGVNGGVDNAGDPLDTRVNLKGRTNTWSLFASDTVSLGELWHVTGSARYNHTRVANRDQITPAGDDSLSGDHTFSRLNPALGVTFTPSKQVSVYLGYNEGSRAPTVIELGCANPDNPCRLPNSMAGDPPLKQVVSRTIEAGVRVRATPNFGWNLGLFRTDNRDDIQFVAAPSGTTYGYFDNVGKTRRQGGELGFFGRADQLTFSANYMYLNATYQDDLTLNGTGNSTNSVGHGEEGGTISVKRGNRIPLIPSHVLKAGVNYQLTPSWLAGLSMVAVSSSFARGNENNAHEAGGTTIDGTQAYLGSGKSPGYAVFNFNTRYKASEQITVFASISNLFDRRYATAAQLGAAGLDANGNVADANTSVQQTTFYAPGAPRAFWVGMKYTFDKPASKN